tara:strand:- start:1210 stop:1326 length:117 start_codon:yes stop_codon:yes gene_type:complete
MKKATINLIYTIISRTMAIGFLGMVFVLIYLILSNGTN